MQPTDYADKLLIKFVKDAEALYGKEALIPMSSVSKSLEAEEEVAL